MRASAITTILVFCLGTSFAAKETEYAPFDDPIYNLASSSLTNSTTESDGLQPVGLFRRQQGSCPSGYNACTNQNAAELCCKTDTICSTDEVANVACCPTNAACTGTINPGTQTGSVGSTTSSESSSDFLVPVSTTSGETAQATAQATGGSGGGNTISNEFYGGFVALPTSFPNAQDCSSAISSCTSEFQKCTAALGGNQNGVTITGNGASVSIQGATTNLGPSATSICQSLSSEACRGSQLANCNGGSTTNTGGAASLANSPNAAPTPCVPVGYGMGLGVAIEVMRQVL